ncbi:OmpA family protein [Azospirillum halopraeferens]|uniref:OmpA family protein n=1 Tax=Azospirillum halopraeferens TaxID=34010 RepID=UPI0004160FE6|nr:OmpA family protein [Azospirillum halopraeferens]
MNKFMRNGLAMVSAAIIAGFASQGMAQSSVVSGVAADGTVWCNPVIGWGNTPVMGSGGPAVHQDSYHCPPTAAAPTPPPAAAVQPQYQVFFDWDRSEITPAADRIIADVVQAVGTGQNARIHVIGHTDTSGPATYNQGLSERRAAAIRQALVARGVPATNITTEGVGETQLLVQTGPNVREPSNRRGQILPRGANMPSS